MSTEPTPPPTLEAELDWVRENMPVTRETIEGLPDLKGVRLACSMHLEIKMLPLIEGLLARGAELFLTTCNPSTVDDACVAWSVARGAKAHAWRGMSQAELARGIDHAIAFRPTHLSEMGAAISERLLGPEGKETRATVRAGLEATGSGTNVLASKTVTYPIFNWDDLAIKEGIHNRRMVGLVACHAFFEKTRLTFHNKRVLVIGQGLVGQSAADAARAYGGRVMVSELDPARALVARFAGEDVVALEEALPIADVIIAATGARHVLGRAHYPKLKDGAFIINVGHLDQELDLPSLYTFPHETVRPHLERVHVEGKRIYLFARGSMANLAAGPGDSFNAFDVTLATLAGGIGFMVESGASFPSGVHLLPAIAWRRVAERALG